MNTIHKVPVCECPVCGTNLDLVTNADGYNTPPKQGDFTVCKYCTTVLVFNGDLTVRVITHKEKLIFAYQNPDTWKNIQDTIKMLQKDE